jgi:hypothetical protein
MQSQVRLSASTCHYRHVGNSRVASKHCLDLREFYAQPVDLHLIVRTAVKEQRAVPTMADNVSGSVQPIWDLAI